MTRIKKAAGPVLVTGVALALVAAGLFALRMQHVLRISKQEVRSRSAIAFETKLYAPQPALVFDRISTPAQFTRAQEFQGDLYIAGPPGLLDYDTDGKLKRQFAVGQDLPSSPLVSLARVVLAGSAREELILATGNDGLLAFDGRQFRQIYPLDPTFREITCIAATNTGHLLIGTKSRGVLVFDGQKFSILHPTLSDLHVTALAGDETDLWVGTIDRGVLHWHAGETETFGPEQGMPDPQVLSIALSGQTVYVGTPVGVAAFDRGKFSRVVAPTAFATALLATPQKLIVGTEDEGVLTIDLSPNTREPPLPQAARSDEVEQLFAIAGDVYVLTKSSLERMNPRGLAWEPVIQRGPSTLTDGDISALAFDASGRLWIGYFTRGLDVVDAPNQPLRHIEDQHVFCVNRILPEAKGGTVDVATANGLVRFGVSGNEEQIVTRADGLIADHVTDVAQYGGGLAVATPAGLTFFDPDGARSLYAFQGLVNNHVYALGVSGDQLLAGTLGGISVIGNEDVRLSYTTANSGLKHNWITAIVPVDGEWMVGTYGAGVLGLASDGRFYSVGDATGAFNVSFNAMLVTPQHVFAGTLGRGFYVYDRESDRWTDVRDGLPSSNVTTFAAHDGYVYVGTDNGLVRIKESELCEESR
jgi:ligand-binding sensor domain-containing protein